MADSIMDIYNDDENVISSDEYSEKDDNDDLMNAAISSVFEKKLEVTSTPQINLGNIRERVGQLLNERRQKKQVRKLGIKLKKKYIKWMTKKFRREKNRKRYLHNLNQSKSSQNEKVPSTEEKLEALPVVREIELQKHEDLETIVPKSKIAHTEPETIDLDDTDEDDFDEDDEDGSSSSSSEDNENDDDEDENEDVIKTIKIYNNVNIEQNVMENIDSNKENNEEVLNLEKQIIPEPEVEENVNIEPQGIEVEIDTQKDIARACIPIMMNTPPKTNTPPPMEMNYIESKVLRVNQKTDVEMADVGVTTDLDCEQNLFLNDELNAMYSSFNKIIDDNVSFPSTAKLIHEKVSLITSEIHNIKRELEVKENEINRLLYAQRIKEEILYQMIRKLRHFEVKNAPVDENKIKKRAIRELGMSCPDDYSQEPPLKKKKMEPRTAREVIERRTEMSMDEILKEKASLSVDESSLLDAVINLKKNDVIPGAGNRGYNSKPNHSNFSQYCSNTGSMSNVSPETRHFSNMSHLMENYSLNDLNDLEERSQTDESFITDKNYSNFLRLGNQNNATSRTGVETFEHTSTLEKLLNKSSTASRVSQQQRSLRRNQANHEEATYEVIIESKNFQRGSQPIPVLNQSKFVDETINKNDEPLIVHLETSGFEELSTPKFQSKYVKRICQYCGINEARFVCADCENQWYCSRNCQVSAWDTHCDSCE